MSRRAGAKSCFSQCTAALVCVDLPDIGALCSRVDNSKVCEARDEFGEKITMLSYAQGLLLLSDLFRYKNSWKIKANRLSCAVPHRISG